MVSVIIYNGISFFKRLYLFFWREWKGGRKRGGETSRGERYMDGLPFTHPQLGTWPGDPGIRPDWDSNQLPLRPSSSKVKAQSTEPHQPGKQNFLKFVSHSFSVSHGRTDQPKLSSSDLKHFLKPTLIDRCLLALFSFLSFP